MTVGRSRQLRVLWVVPGFPSESDPAQYPFLGREAELLVSAGISVVTVVADTRGSTVDGQPVSASGWSRPMLLLWLLRHPRIARRFLRRRPSEWVPVVRRLWALDRVLVRERPDLVHSHFAEPMGTGGVDIARARGVGTVVSLRGVDVATCPDLDYGYRLQCGYADRLRRTLAAADRVLVATSRMRDLALDAGALEATTRVHPNPASDLRGRARTAWQLPRSDARVIACVGSLDHRKNFSTAIEALSLLPGHHLVIVGHGPERDRLAALATDFAVEDRVRFLGRVAPDVVADVLHRATVFWSTARFEAFGNAILEAALHDCALVCTDQGVAVDLVPELDRAAFFDGSAEDLARRTVDVLAADRRSRDGVLDRYASEAWVRRMVSLYEEVAHVG